MSGQWEVVGKNKKGAQNGKVKAPKEEKPKITDSASKTLPAQQQKSDEAKPKSGKENKNIEVKKSNVKKAPDTPKAKSAKSTYSATKQQPDSGKSESKKLSFPDLIKRLPSSGKNAPDNFNNEALTSIIECLYADSSNFKTWRQLYGKQTKQSIFLLSYINLNWSQTRKLIKEKPLKETLKDIQMQNNESLKKSKKKDETLVESNRICQEILDKMARSRGFPWFWASFFVFSTIVGLLIFDSNQMGSFEKSRTGKLLKDMDMYDTTVRVWQQSLGHSARGYIWLENNTPYYCNTAIEFSKPYVAITYDFAVVGGKAGVQLFGNIRDYAAEKTPLVSNKIEQYAPGLIENVQTYTCSAWRSVKDFSVHYYGVSVQYLQTKVLIGNWAPEVLKAKTLQALNTTQIYAAKNYGWFRKQVDLYSKVK